MTISEESKTIRDLYLAATFLSYGLKLSDINRENPRHFTFTFSGRVDICYIQTPDSQCEVVNNPTLDFIELNYISRTLLFPPEYPDSIRRMKTMIHTD